jgi:FkbH-like protein
VRYSYDLQLLDALEIIRRASLDNTSDPFRLGIACSFPPLHFATFLHAKTQLALHDRRVVLTAASVYNDLVGSLQQASEAQPDASAVVIEWPDLDQRLGVRRLGGWGPDLSNEIGENVQLSLARIKAGVAALAKAAPVVVSPPTLFLPPFSHEAGWQAGVRELRIRSCLAAFLAEIAEFKSVRVISSQALDCSVMPQERFDLKSEINAGFAYNNKHACALAGVLAQAIVNRSPKKGLITDLDDTLWRGILGEVGVNGVGWDLEGRAHIHGLYQQYLAALARRGVLVAAVSKNDPQLVEELLRQRHDLLLTSSDLYPIDAGWGRKSEAVSRVLQAWNISADTVVFVDDSPMELEEVKTAHPSMETFQFSTDNPVQVWNLIGRLQDLFGKPELLDEDRLRMASMRSRGEFTATESGPSEDQFLEQVQAQVTVDIGPRAADRVLELLNKTNQFNLNGKRLDDGQLQQHLNNPKAFLFVISYKDKFGPLGRIAVIMGYRDSAALRVTHWAMSCRAFARRVEHQCMRFLFEWSGAEKLILDYASTPRNTPFREFLSATKPGTLGAPVCIWRPDFEAHCPQLFHAVVRSTHA